MQKELLAPLAVSIEAKAYNAGEGSAAAFVPSPFLFCLDPLLIRPGYSSPRRSAKIVAMGSLQEQLDSITAMTRELVQAERLAVSENAIADLFATGIEERILKSGQPAPDFELESNNGHIVRSADLLALGALVVKFFRGRWCAYDVTELEAWRDLHARLRSMGAFFVAVSAQTVQQNDFFVAQHDLPFPILRDERCQLAERFGLAYRVPEHMRDYYRSILVNVPYVNGEESWRLPLAAAYVIGRDGRILFAEAHADYRVRPEPEDVLAALA